MKPFGDHAAETLGWPREREGKPRQQVVGPDDGPMQVEYKTIEEVHMFLLNRGIDAARLPPPPLKLVEHK